MILPHGNDKMLDQDEGNVAVLQSREKKSTREKGGCWCKESGKSAMLLSNDNEWCWIFLFQQYPLNEAILPRGQRDVCDWSIICEFVDYT